MMVLTFQLAWSGKAATIPVGRVNYTRSEGKYKAMIRAVWRIFSAGPFRRPALRSE